MRKTSCKNLTVSTAESCTGGFISHKITVVPGSSDYYLGSIISYNNLIKEELLEVDKKTIESKGVVSREVVEHGPYSSQKASYKLQYSCIQLWGLMAEQKPTSRNCLDCNIIQQ